MPWMLIDWSVFLKILELGSDYEKALCRGFLQEHGIEYLYLEIYFIIEI